MTNEEIENVTITIFDITGRLVYSKNNINTTSIEVSLIGLTKGIYYVKAAVNSSEMFNKIIVQ